MDEYMNPQTERFVRFVETFVEENPAIAPFYENELAQAEISRIYNLLNEALCQIDFQTNTAAYSGFEACINVIYDLNLCRSTPDDFNELYESFLCFVRQYIKQNHVAAKALNGFPLIGLKEVIAQKFIELRNEALHGPGILHDDPEFQPKYCSREVFESGYRAGFIRGIDECTALALAPILMSV